MKIKTYEKNNDLALVRYDDKYYYIGCIDLPQKEWTVDQYNEWCGKYTQNLISLTTDFVPQILPNSRLIIEETLTECDTYWRNKYKAEKHLDYSFKALLLHLLSEQSKGKFISSFSSFIQNVYKPQA